MNLQQTIDATDGGLPALAEKVGCSTTHLYKTALGLKPVSTNLSKAIKQVAPDFSLDDQDAVFRAKQKSLEVERERRALRQKMRARESAEASS